VPVDGVVREGESSVDESMITGEPIPAYKKLGDPLTGGTLNGNGSLIMEAAKVGNETLLAQIVKLVSEASRSRAPIQNLADRFSRYFVPAVILVALATFFAWTIFGPEPNLVYGLISSVTVLLIACPCALGLATPMSIMVGTGKGAQYGVLIKDAAALEKLVEISTLVVDKTGTLTEGKPRLESVLSFSDTPEEELIGLAASLELGSEHPLANALVKAAKDRSLQLKKVKDFQSHTGKGITGVINNQRVAIGNKHLMEELDFSLEEDQSTVDQLREKGQTLVYLVMEGKLIGILGMVDPLKENSGKAISDIKKLGIKIHVLTGDDPLTASAVANALDLEEVEAGVSPQQKVEYIEQLKSKGEKVAMAGDGINDAPALVSADVGIAMGNGTDIAIESSDITLVKGDLTGIIRARKLSQSVMRNVRQNLFFAFIYNSLGIPIAAGLFFPLFGILLSPMVAAAAMSFSSVSVILNSLRLQRLKL